MADGDVTGKVTRKTLYTLTFLANIKEKQLIQDVVRVTVAKAISLFVKRVMMTDKIQYRRGLAGRDDHEQVI